MENIYLIIGVVILILGIGIAIGVSVKHRSDRKKENMDNEKERLKIRIPDEEKTVIPNMVQEEKHKIIRLYQSPRVEGVWICRCCEAENRITDSHCSVCGNYK